MKDNLGIFAHAEDTGELDVDELRAALSQTTQSGSIPAQRGPRPHAAPQRRARRVEVARRRKRRLRSSLTALMVLALIGGGVFLGIRLWSEPATPQSADYAGAGSTETIVKINGGDGLSDIARSLAAVNVVKSPEAFVAAAQGNKDLAAIQPGYYKVRQEASAGSTVTALLTSANRVGKLALIPGNTLADTTSVKTGEVLPGYVSQLTAAACVPLNGASNCFTVDQMWNAVRTTPLSDLGLNDWALSRVSQLSDLDRRLEGMIFPDTYDIPPTADPGEVLRYVMHASAVKWNATPLVTKAQATGRSPYDLAIIASLVEREGITKDMPRVAEVIYNRLRVNMILQLDSTVNYGLNESQIGTREADRSDPTSPYNTYQHAGLPPSPIGGIGPAALSATLEPAQGPWMYFVKVDTAGNSCFTVTLPEHEACVAQAQANGVFG